MELIQAGWMPLSDACRQIGMSPRTMETWVRNKKIRSKLVQREGRSPERLFEAADVARLAKEKEQKRISLKQQTETALTRTDRAAAQELAEIDRRYIEQLAATDRKYEDRAKQLEEQLNKLLAHHSEQTSKVLAQHAEQTKKMLETVAPKQWLSPQEASEVSGLSVRYLLTMIELLKIRAVQGGPRRTWRIQRASLEVFARS